MIQCPSGIPTFTFQRFDVEQDYDFVRMYDGGAAEGEPMEAGSLTGGMSSLGVTRFSSSGAAMAIQFTSDESIGAEGFEGVYECGDPGGGPPPPPQFTHLNIGASPVIGEATDVGGVWYTFDAQQGNTYQLDTEVGTLRDTILELVDLDQRTTIAENDDDSRATGRLDSFIEWTCPVSGTYFVNVKGFSGDTGTFTIYVDQDSAQHGGDPCDGGTVMMEQAATISFMPPGGTEDDQQCSWQIRCLGPNEGVHINFQVRTTHCTLFCRLVH